MVKLHLLNDTWFIWTNIELEIATYGIFYTGVMFIHSATAQRNCFWGNVNDDLVFDYENDAYAYNGCGATLMGQFWYFGGTEPLKTMRQV